MFWIVGVWCKSEPEESKAPLWALQQAHALDCSNVLCTSAVWSKKEHETKQARRESERESERKIVLYLRL